MIDPLDRLAIAYLALPLLIFLCGWLEPWAAIPLLLGFAVALRPLLVTVCAAMPVTRLQIAVATAVGCAWTACGGTLHWVFANADWHLRDAVLHDLVAGEWPVGYGALGGAQTLLRAPIGYYLPAALIGKSAGLLAAHAALAAWTALGATLFLLQVLAQSPSSPRGAVTAAAVIVFFSGLDIVGTLLNARDGAGHGQLASHLEWWAGSYQYSSMTTQLFWVPNHALCGWLAVGLVSREAGATQRARAAALAPQLPMVLVAVTLASPLTALGLAPFVIARVGERVWRERDLSLLHPRIWAPALALGLVVAAYLTLDSGRVPRGWTVGGGGAGMAGLSADLLRQAEFFFLEAGCIGLAVLALRRSSDLVLALVILALLPVASFGSANDLAMRASIPSLTVLAIGASLALAGKPGEPPRGAPLSVGARKALLGCLLLVGAVTPLHEIARAALLPAWPINREATLIGAACGRYPAHYVARLGESRLAQAFEQLLRSPHALPLGHLGPAACENPAVRLMKERGLPWP